MSQPRRVIVHSLSHAQAAAAAAVAHDVAVVLQSAPAAAANGGPAWWLHVIAEARAAQPRAKISDVLDCGPLPGMALAALRRGCKTLRLDAAPAMRTRIADIAAQCGARLDDAEEPALDLLGESDPLRACLLWLAPEGRF
ncbi:hypothetical protein [Telmatospirillum sp. J64-1]|uniref:hypothetical protein n=1 Tax=Telmatospirillum sp. J64-1 TaxID=2502183 RepID=UPI00115D9CAF|nr:hypothetical protein [Telmatospirillum sp. J64-1]